MLFLEHDLNIGNVLSLFDGMSCGQIALNKLGIKYDNYFASEICKSSMFVTQHNYPNTIQLGDVRNIKSEDLSKIDLLIGGSPCTGFSFAGKQLNFEDPQSKLFFEYLRLKNELQPKYFFLENVNMKEEYLDVITNFMGVHPIKINSADFSAQDRIRWYWTNIPVNLEYEKSKLVVEDILDYEVHQKYIIDTKRSVIICDNEVDRRKIAYIATDSQGNRVYNIHHKSVTLSANGGGLGGKTGLYALPIISPDKLKSRQNGHRFKPPKSKFYTLTAIDRHGILTNNFIRRLTPTECERLQTVPVGYTDVGVSENQRYKMLGNGWTVDVIAHIFSGMIHGYKNSLW